MKSKNLQADRENLSKEARCPFCNSIAEAVVMKGHLGFCTYIVCASEKCKMKPSTPLFEGKTVKGALTKAKEIWNRRKGK